MLSCEMEKVSVISRLERGEGPLVIASKRNSSGCIVLEHQRYMICMKVLPYNNIRITIQGKEIICICYNAKFISSALFLAVEV